MEVTGAEHQLALEGQAEERDPAPQEEPTGSTPLGPQEYLFLTNRYNLLEIQSSGLLAPVEAFDKYYDDLLRLCPGRVVLLTGPVDPRTAALVTEADDPGAFPVILQFTARRTFQAERLEGDEQTAGLTDSPPAALAVEGALAVGDAVVHFRSDAELTEHRLSSYENVAHDRFRYAVSPWLFAGASGIAGRLTDWLGGLHRGPDLGASFRRCDGLGGSEANLANVVALYPESVEGYATVLGGGDPGASPAARSDWPPWLNPAEVLWSQSAAPREAEPRLLLGLAQALAGVGRATGFRNADVLSEARRIALKGRPRKADAEAIKTSMDRVEAVLDTRADLIVDDPGIPLSTARGGLYALLRPDPRRLLTFLREERPQDAWSALTAGALVGTLVGRRRLDVSLRAAALDRLLARKAELLLQGEPTDLDVETETLRDDAGRAASRVVFRGTTLLQVELPAPSLVDLLEALDLDTEPAKPVALELARTLGWGECVRSTVFLPLGVDSLRYDPAKKAIAFDFLGNATVERRIEREHFLRRLRSTPLPEELEDRLRRMLADTDAAPAADPPDADGP
ncbi:hypothetical protein [Miltoncostaea marina]|uniref:hypothetical protein n=1 Tax=Miltoncostaea marina TaxID=2843215 RepID=UPI001C3CFD86|nr:hypothetical protein [Miltoncostaea marina]